MKRWMTAVCVFCMGAGLSYGSGLGAFVSRWDPDEGEDSDGVGGKLSLDLGEAVGIELRGTYFDEDALTVIPADAGLVLKIPLAEDAITLFGSGGATWYFLDSDAGDVDDEVGWYAGGGLEIRITDGLSIFAEAHYRSLEYTATDDDPEELEDLDVDVTAMTYSAGLMLTW